jgi:hypothetical protein
MSSDDAERLLAGAEAGPGDSASLATLHQLFAAARRPGAGDDVAAPAAVVEAFRTAALPIRRPTVPREVRFKAVTRRTVAILGIATGASLGTAFATGAVGNPFTAPAPVILGPGTTQHAVRPVEPPPATASVLEHFDTIPSRATIDVASDPDPAVTPTDQPPPVSVPTSIENAAGTTATAGPSELNPSSTARGHTEPPPSATAPGQTGLTPSGTAPGQTGLTPSATAPGQTGLTPSATAPGHTEPNPSGTAPGHTEPPPSATAPGHTEPSPSATAPGHSREG